MTIKELRASTGMTQNAFSEYFGIPKRNIENWEGGQHACYDYLIKLMQYKLDHDGLATINSNSSMAVCDGMTIKELRASSGMTQKAFAAYFGFSKRALENWEGGQRACPDYLMRMIHYKLEHEGLLQLPAKADE